MLPRYINRQANVARFKFINVRARNLGSNAEEYRQSHDIDCKRQSTVTVF